MLARIKAMQVGKTGLRMAALVAGSQLTVAAAKVGGESAMAGGCGAENALHVVGSLGQTAWNIVSPCIVGQIVQVGGALLGSDCIFNPVNAIVNIIGHEVIAHVVSLVFQVLS